MHLGTGRPHLGNPGNFSALVIPHVRPTVFQMFSSPAPKNCGTWTQGVKWKWAPARLILSGPLEGWRGGRLSYEQSFGYCCAEG
jgi:hypothetical protein